MEEEDDSGKREEEHRRIWKETEGRYELMNEDGGGMGNWLHSFLPLICLGFPNGLWVWRWRMNGKWMGQKMDGKK
jgi:hypothetical protein